ncbi:MAG: hypothetical protein JJE23_06260 [Thermoleophilia bacterium]|nr:hypothetical protein [Thermoleophilia bacterium]
MTHSQARNVPFTPELMGWPGYPGPRIGRPEGRTYVELALAVYETSEPTVAQVKAVQRAAKRLAAAGRVETSWHQRDAFEVVVRRLPTADDHRCRAEVERREREWKLARAEAAAKASNYPIDTGTTGIVEVAVEPVLKITADGVELREVRA